MSEVRQDRTSGRWVIIASERARRPSGLQLAGKSAVAARTLVYMNTNVTRGAGEFVITATGMATEVGHISGMLQEQQAVKTPLTRQMDRLSIFRKLRFQMIADKGQRPEAAEAITGPPIPTMMWIFMAGLILAGCLHVVAVMIQPKPIPSPPHVQPISTPPSIQPVPTALPIRRPISTKDRIVVDVTVEYLLSLYKIHTTLQAEQLIKPYIDKWLTVSGIIEDLGKRIGSSELGLSFRSFQSFYVV